MMIYRQPLTLLVSALAFAGAAVRGVVIDTEGLPDTGLNTSTWTEGTLPPLSDIWTLNDIQIAAKNVLEPRYYASYRTAALDEITYQANLNIWKQVRLNGFSFRDVSDLKLSTTILGHNFSLPFFIAPAAKAGHASKSAELSLVTAAGKAGILYVPSISSTKSIEQIAAAGLDNQTMFHQEYVWCALTPPPPILVFQKRLTSERYRSNKTQLKDELKRMEKAGFKAVFLTVDNTGVNGIRDRSLRYTGTESDTGHSATFDLESLAALRNLTSLPLVPKGVKTAADAKKCLDLGFPAVYISNHGGRVLDGAPTAVEILLDIRKNYPEVFERMEVYADGGVRRGTDVMILLALGARAVGLGRSPMFANIWGEEGVTHMIDLLKTELSTSMQLMGASDVTALNSSYVNTKWVEQQYFGSS
ncbi:FMN-dependent alpha-hydroxy acid dehydrogenase [Punctularia strigosozonata HHB-11173 SS5]|uniref:FMN-dependent alpha-hydroxy acid dehydrogenase n=1 Tax=Punctularia strigosozonata (strain HHB-11173) TaxID=741275 RepID=R7S5M2_PUNST|nr:FMN-dependent alpha-hydroxy acid dehydrogenase [Punctularia strigosozonata HHB-11173 SS5]EIN05302.1 FMN-dependent alpha-hydroxy acid dehydrogenase [Punctularia strigosozonata HHB-11173 SS5]